MKVCFYGEICDISHSYVDDILHNNIELSTLENADVVIFTGCGYEKTKIEYSASTLEDVIKKMKKGAKLGVFGCVTAYDDFYNQYRGRSEIDYIGRGTGLEMQNEIKQYLASNSVNVNATGVGFYLTFKKRLNLIIQDGCNNRCAFCKSNYLDLHLHSRPMDSILKLIDDMHKTTGIDEINIMGLNPSQYGLDLYGTRSLDKLIQKISALDYINTIFLDMLCISDITNDLLLEIISNPKIKRVMIPIQSLDNELLK